MYRSMLVHIKPFFIVYFVNLVLIARMWYGAGCGDSPCQLRLGSASEQSDTSSQVGISSFHQIYNRIVEKKLVYC